MVCPHHNKDAGDTMTTRHHPKQALCQFQMGREEAGFPDRLLIRAVGVLLGLTPVLAVNFLVGS